MSAVDLKLSFGICIVEHISVFKCYVYFLSSGWDEGKHFIEDILDICFGLGYNTAAALDLGPSTVYCFENNKEILKKVLEIDAEFESYSIIKEFIKGFFEGNNVYEKDNIKLIMLFGDARENIKKLKEKADYVFFDPFSPAKVPELWTEEFFRDIKNKMKPEGKLSTYSCARKVRENMKKAGFEVLDGPILGRRSPSTVCRVIS